MIRIDDLTEIGALYKPHGIKGEISAGLDYDISPDQLRCVVIDVDGIFVPFFIESWRERGPGRLLLKLEGVDDETAAAALAKRPFYGITAELPLYDQPADDGIYLYDLVGYEMLDGDRPVGKITAVDDSTENILFHVEDAGGRIIFVPYAEDWIQEFDPDRLTITMNLPEGIIDLN